MATLYLKCGTGVSSFVIHSKSSSAYPKTVTSTSYTAYAGFAATTSDAYISDVVYKSGYSGATIYSSTTGTEWSVSSDPYISLKNYSSRNAEVRAKSSPTYKVSCSSGTGISKFTYLNSTTSGTGTTVTSVSGLNVGSRGYLYLKDFAFESGYGYPVTVTCSNPSGSWSISDSSSGDRKISPPSSGGTRSVTLTATKKTYKVSCSSGTGISKFTYLDSTTSGTGTTVTSVSGLNVGSGGYLYLKDFAFESGYGYPVTVTCSNPSGSWSIPNSSSGDRKISPPSSGGTRSATLTATQKPTYTLTCYFGSEINSATFDNGTTVTKREGWGSMTYFDNVKITGISLSEVHSSWNGYIYWRSHGGTTSYTVGQIVNGNIIIRGSSDQEPISCTGNRSIDIYAVITVTKKYRVHAFGNGGTTSGGNSELWWPSDQSYWESDDASFDFPLNRISSFTKPNSVFVGWAYGSTPTAGESAYTTTIRLNASESGETNNIHAVWESYTYVLKYDANGGSNPPADQTYGPTADQSHSFIIPDKVPTRVNYFFVGWASSSTATEASYHPGDSASVLQTSPNQTRTLYAVWERSYTYVLKYDANGGSNPPADQTYGPTADQSHSFVIPSKLPTRVNYLFIGWASSSTATEASYHPGDSVSVLQTSPNQTRTLYAVWKSKPGVEPHFYWYNRDDPTMTDAEKEAFDYTKIKSGLKREMTAAMWAAFADKTERLARLCGTSVSIAKPSKGTNMIASQYNNGIYALQVIKNALYSSVYIPNTVRSEIDYINASQFHSNSSIKTCLNKLIDDYNNGGGDTYDN